MKKHNRKVTVFHVRVKYVDGTEEIEQFDIDKYRKVMALFVTPFIKRSGFIMNGKEVYSIQLYKPNPDELMPCPILTKKCIRPDGGCENCFVANEIIKDLFSNN